MKEIEKKLTSISDKLEVPESGKFNMPAPVRKKVNYKKAIPYLLATACICIFFITGMHQSILPSMNSKKGSSPTVDSDGVNAEIRLNPISDNHIALNIVEFNCSEENFNKSVPVYLVQKPSFTQEQIDVMIKKIGMVKPKEIKEKDILILSDDKGNQLYINEKTGSIVFMSERIQTGKADEIFKNPLPKEEYIEKAKQWIKELGFLEELKVYSAGEVMYQTEMEQGEESRKAIRYGVSFVRSALNGMEFSGNGPGIKVEFDASGEIVSFLRINRDVKQSDINKVTKSKEEILEAFQTEAYLVSGVKSDTAKIEINECRLVLYSDPMTMVQTHMIPMFEFSGVDITNNTKVKIIMNSLKTTDYKIHAVK